MKKIFLLFLMVVIYSTTIAQGFDAIIKKDGTTVQGKLLKVTDKTIEFDPKGNIPFIIIDRSIVESILYSDGTLVKMGDAIIPENNNVQNKIEKTKPLKKFLDKNGDPIDNVSVPMYFGRITPSTYQNLARGFEGVFYSDEDENEYEVALMITCKVDMKAGSVFSKTSTTKIRFTNVSYKMAIGKNTTEVLEVQDFPGQDFSIDISQSSYRGTTTDLPKDIIKFPEYESPEFNLVYDNATFISSLKVSNGIYYMDNGIANYYIFGHIRIKYN